jgi:hypothetical protein
MLRPHGHGEAACVKQPQFRAVKTLLGNLRNAINGTYDAFNFAKYAHRCLAEFQVRFNRRFDMKTILLGLLASLVEAPPSPEHWLRVVRLHANQVVR